VLRRGDMFFDVLHLFVPAPAVHAKRIQTTRWRHIVKAGFDDAQQCATLDFLQLEYDQRGRFLRFGRLACCQLHHFRREIETPLGLEPTPNSFEANCSSIKLRGPGHCPRSQVQCPKSVCVMRTLDIGRSTLDYPLTQTTCLISATIFTRSLWFLITCLMSL
jgi:hypothetical protein